MLLILYPHCRSINTLFIFNFANLQPAIHTRTRMQLRAKAEEAMPILGRLEARLQRLMNRGRVYWSFPNRRNFV